MTKLDARRVADQIATPNRRPVYKGANSLSREVTLGSWVRYSYKFSEYVPGADCACSNCRECGEYEIRTVFIIGQVWAQGPDRGQWWIADGNGFHLVSERSLDLLAQTHDDAPIFAEAS